MRFDPVSQEYYVGEPTMNYDLWISTEPDDSDVVYTRNWKAAERSAKRMVESARQINERDAEVKEERDDAGIPCSKCGQRTSWDPTYQDLCYRCCRASNE